MFIHLQADPHSPWGFDPDASLPPSRHFGRVLRALPNKGDATYCLPLMGQVENRLGFRPQYGACF